VQQLVRGWGRGEQNVRVEQGKEKKKRGWRREEGKRKKKNQKKKNERKVQKPIVISLSFLSKNVKL
jgi:hypothetical protein